MIPKIRDLFGEVSDIERLFMEPDAFPWTSLTAMTEFMLQYAGDRGSEPWVEPSLTWPEAIPCYRECIGGNGTSPLFMTVDRPVHVRGGWGLKCDRDVYVRGPVVFGRGVRLRKGVVVTGPCFIGNGVIVGQGCRVKHSIIRADTELEYNVRVAYSVIGAGAFIGQHAVLNHRRLDGRSIVIGGLDDEPVRTGLADLGLMAGDRSRVGGGAVILPGTILLPHGMIPEGMRVEECDAVSSG